MTSFDDLHARRLASWAQTSERRIPDAEAAARLIERIGLATLFPASPELPNLFHAYTGDPEARSESAWDSPAGHVYGWRWDLGRAGAAFYTTVVRDRPTWISWALLPAVLRLGADLRPPQELHERGELSADALRLARALATAGGVLTTGDLRQAAGFPTGKAQRAAYLKAVLELDSRMLLAKVFSPEDTEMRHALVAVRHPDAVTAASGLSTDEALDRLLDVYLPHAIYAVPAVLAKHLRLPLAPLRAGLERLVARGAAEPITLPGHRELCYAWAG